MWASIQRFTAPNISNSGAQNELRPSISISACAGKSRKACVNKALLKVKKKRKQNLGAQQFRSTVVNEIQTCGHQGLNRVVVGNREHGTDIFVFKRRLKH